MKHLRSDGRCNILEKKSSIVPLQLPSDHSFVDYARSTNQRKKINLSHLRLRVDDLRFLWIFLAPYWFSTVDYFYGNQLTILDGQWSWHHEPLSNFDHACRIFLLYLKKQQKKLDFRRFIVGIILQNWPTFKWRYFVQTLHKKLLFRCASSRWLIG